jgi:alpha-L-arabinofuranosidase
MNEKQMRAEFEAWYVPEHDRYREQCLQRNKNGDYLLKGVFDAWETWQACQAVNNERIEWLKARILLYEKHTSEVGEKLTTICKHLGLIE